MIKMDHMRPGEKVELVIKRHWIVYVFLFSFFIFAVIFTSILYTIFGGHPINHLVNIIIWMLFAMFLYIEWLNIELDMFVITNNRVIGIEQISFLNRAVSECNLGQVQEVNSKASGLLANVLNYGVITIQTAGNKTTLTMDYAPEAMQGARKILNIVDHYRDTQAAGKKEV